jgi:hypothetical protein
VSDLGLVMIVVGLALMTVSGLLVSVVRSGLEYGYRGIDR